jgi:hypothetical protein
MAGLGVTGLGVTGLGVTGRLGHNGGPSLAPGESWRRFCWQKARQDLLPSLPIEVLRLRVKRAQDLGLDYRTYASVRAASGHDVVAFLFSSNALRIWRDPALPPDREARLQIIRTAQRIALAQGVAPAVILQANASSLEAAHPAPRPFAPFAEARVALRAALPHIPGDRVILIGDTALEAEWCAAGRLAAYLPADRFFPAP